MQVERDFPLTAALIRPFAAALDGDETGYRNHVFRVLNFFRALHDPAQEVPEAVLIAAAFHDLGIWTDDTFDYLAPSVRLAVAYLAGRRLDHLAPEVTALIDQHHKLRRYTGRFAAGVEAFRRADLVDLSLGAIRFGLPASFVGEVRASFPNAGFHRRLALLTSRQCLRAPLRPLPMMRW